MSIVGKLGGVEGKNVISELVKGGGGSGGGGPLIIRSDYSDDDEYEYYTLDHTYKEIFDAVNSGKLVLYDDSFLVTDGSDIGKATPIFWVLKEIFVQKSEMEIYYARFVFIPFLNVNSESDNTKIEFSTHKNAYSSPTELYDDHPSSRQMKEQGGGQQIGDLS